MIETYAFIVNGITQTFADLKSTYGMYLREVTDTGAVSWNIATNKNPYQDGVSVNNRTANPREITISFGYDRKVEPDVADAYLFSYLSVVNGKVTLRKTKGTKNKWIDGTIQSIEHLVYTDEPTLQVVLLTDSYWRGATVQTNLKQICHKSGDYYIFDTFAPTNEVIPYIELELDVYYNASELTSQSIEFYLYDKFDGDLQSLNPSKESSMFKADGITIGTVDGYDGNNKIPERIFTFDSNKVSFKERVMTAHTSISGTTFTNEENNLIGKLAGTMTNPSGNSAPLITRLTNGNYANRYAFKVSSGIETLMTTINPMGFSDDYKCAYLYLIYRELYIR